MNQMTFVKCKFTSKDTTVESKMMHITCFPYRAQEQQKNAEWDQFRTPPSLIFMAHTCSVHSRFITRHKVSSTQYALDPHGLRGPWHWKADMHWVDFLWIFVFIFVFMFAPYLRICFCLHEISLDHMLSHRTDCSCKGGVRKTLTAD